MRRLVLALVCVVTVGLIATGDAVLHACGAKFLVSSRGARYQRVLANIESTSILWYYEEDPTAPEDEQWDPAVEEWLAGVGHTVEVAFDVDTFLGAAKNGDFDVILIHIDQARELQDQIAALEPDAAMVPILTLPSRSQYTAAREEFGIVMKMPTTSPKFLAGIEKARRTVRP